MTVVLTTLVLQFWDQFASNLDFEKYSFQPNASQQYWTASEANCLPRARL